MPKYRKKPVVIESIQWTGDNLPTIQCFVGADLIHPSVIDNGELFKIRTLEGDMVCNIGDYIIKGVKGEFYPCKPDIFEMTYELVI